MMQETEGDLNKYVPRVLGMRYVLNYITGNQAIHVLSLMNWQWIWIDPGVLMWQKRDCGRELRARDVQGHFCTFRMEQDMLLKEIREDRMMKLVYQTE